MPARNACVVRAPFASVVSLPARSRATSFFLHRARRVVRRRVVASRPVVVRPVVRARHSFIHSFPALRSRRGRRRARTAATALGSFIAFALVPDPCVVARFPIVISFQS